MHILMTNNEMDENWAWPPYPDARMLTDVERKQLCHMLYIALLEIRSLGWDGKTEQMKDLADAFHNLPDFLWSEKFSMSTFRKFLQAYQQKYGKECHSNYLEMFDRINQPANE